jgi:murein DD-endopeptidase MepM/ murein hydrolase activator NlpD
MFRDLLKTGVVLGVVLCLAIGVAALLHGPDAAQGQASTGRPAGAAPRARAAARPAAAADAPGVPADTDVFGADLQRLRARELRFPVPGVDARTLRDDFADARGARAHEAIDILAPRGTPVVAVDDGTVVKLFNSARGGLTVYQFEPTASYCYYYAHLDRYAAGLREGLALKKGDLVGYVGTTGNAPPQTPHLHFAIFKLGPEKRWWEGVAVNPFTLWAVRSG